MDVPAAISCPSCSAPLTGNFCAACGQRAPRPLDFSWKRFAQEAWQEGAGGDSRLWRTLAGLFRPGVLTRGWLEYRWRHYLPPLRLYLLVSAVFFLLAWDVYFQSQVAAMRNAPPGAIPPEVRALFADRSLSDRVSDWTAFYRFLGVLALGVLVKLLHVRKRLPIGRHLVFATHYYCADYAIFLVLAPVLHFSPASAYAAAVQGVTVAGIAWLVWWAVLADRRVYGSGWAGAVVRGLAVVGADVLISLVAGQFAMVSMMIARA